MRRILLSAVCALALVGPTLAQAQTYHGMVGNNPFMVLTIPAPPPPVECCNIALPALPAPPPPPLPVPHYQQQHNEDSGAELSASFSSCVRGVERRLGYGFSDAINGCIVLSFTRFNWSKDYAVEGCMEVAAPLTQMPDEVLRPNCEKRYANNYARWGK